MKVIDVKCECISLMKMHGVDKKLEYRASSFKGMMRFWWRAINPQYSLKDLKEEEGIIFGNNGTYKSPFCLNITDISKNKKKFTMQFIFNNNEVKYQNKIINIFMLSTLLGGFGMRARRGYGSIKIMKIDKKKVDLYDVSRIKDLIETVNPQYNTVVNDLKNKIQNEINIIPEYPFLLNFQIGKNERSADDYLKVIDKSSSDNNDDSLGFIATKYNKSKLASPIYVSLIPCKDENVVPIISRLYNKQYLNISSQDNFIKGVL